MIFQSAFSNAESCISRMFEFNFRQVKFDTSRAFKFTLKSSEFKAARKRDASCPRSSASWLPAKIGKYVRWSGTQVSSYNAHGVVKNAVKGARVSTTTPYWCAVVKCTRDRAAISCVFASAPHPDPRSLLNFRLGD